MPQGAEAFGSISVIIPAYNAAKFIEATVRSVRAWLSAEPLMHEIIVVDDGSCDGTADAAQRLAGVHVLINGKNRGKGFSVRRGMLASKHAWALFMDADNSTSIDHLDRFAMHAAAADVIIGSRRVDGARIMRRQHRFRQFLGRSFPYLVRAIAIPDVQDTQCGFKLFRREAIEPIFSRLRTERFAFDVEALLLARRLGLRIVEVPVDWDNPTTSTLRISVDTIQMLMDVLRASWRIRACGKL